jgi:hypothetical protein
MFDSIIYEEDRVVSEKDLSGILIRITNTHRVGVELELRFGRWLKTGTEAPRLKGRRDRRRRCT